MRWRPTGNKYLSRERSCRSDDEARHEKDSTILAFAIADVDEIVTDARSAPLFLNHLCLVQENPATHLCLGSRTRAVASW